MSERIEYFDVLRGLAILGVVAIHASAVGLQFSDGSANLNFTVLWRNFLNFSVPLFLAISGYFLASQPASSSGEHLAFLKKQIPRVYFPLFFWSLAWLCIAVVVFNKQLSHEIFKLLVFQSSGTYYFIALIIQYYLLLPVFRKLANNKGLMLSVVISLLATCVVFIGNYYYSFDLPLIVYAGNFATWQMFFVLGLYLGSGRRVKISNKFLVPIALTFYLLSCVESFFLISLFGRAGDAVTAVKATSFMYSFFLIIFLFKNGDLIKSKLLKKLGDVSFGIYLIHMFALLFFSKAILILSPKIVEFSYAHQFLLIGLVVFSCCFLISVCNRFITNKQARILGFK